MLSRNIIRPLARPLNSFSTRSAYQKRAQTTSSTAGGGSFHAGLFVGTAAAIGISIWAYGHFKEGDAVATVHSNVKDMQRDTKNTAPGK